MAHPASHTTRACQGWGAACCLWPGTQMGSRWSRVLQQALFMLGTLPRARSSCASALVGCMESVLHSMHLISPETSVTRCMSSGNFCKSLSQASAYASPVSVHYVLMWQTGSDVEDQRRDRYLEAPLRCRYIATCKKHPFPMPNTGS